MKMQLSKIAFTGFGLTLSYFIQQSSCSQLFSDSSTSISEAPYANQLSLGANSHPNVFISPARERFRRSQNQAQNGKGSTTLNTLFSGVYPLVNLTLLGHESQSFVAIVDTGSADTWVVSKDFQCLDLSTQAPVPQSVCDFGALYDPAKGIFTNITSQEFAVGYFPENDTLIGDIGFVGLQLGGLTVPKQEVAIVTTAAWGGSIGVTSSLIGLGYPSMTSAQLRSNGSAVKYDPIFTTMVKDGIVNDAVFTLAINRVPRDTSPTAPAGTMALGGLVSPEYYFPPFTSVPIEVSKQFTETTPTFYTLTHELVYRVKNGTIVSGGTYQSALDCGTAPNFVPSPAAADINAQFSPPGVFNESLGYWTVDCTAKAPYVAFIIGGNVMPMDPQDMIVRSLNGLPGFEDVCFSSIADGGPATAEDGTATNNLFIIGEVWHRSHVVAYDIGRTMMHFAPRRPY